MRFRARLRPLFYHPNGFWGCTPQYYLIVIVPLQTAHGIQLAVIDSCSIRSGRQLNSRSVRKVVSAPSDYDTPGWYIERAFVHLLPYARVIGWGGVCNLHRDRNDHVSNRPDADHSRRGRQHTMRRFRCPAFREIGRHTLVLQIELEVVGKQLEFKASIHLFTTAREPRVCFSRRPLAQQLS